MHWLGRRSTGTSIAGALAVGGAILWVLPPPARVIEVDSSNRMQAAAPAATLRGAFHVHSRWSDGSGTVDEVAAAAAAADLDFVVLTDHGDATISRPPSYRSGVLVIQGVEIGTDGGHYVALGLPAAPYPLGGDPRGVVEDVRRLGGFGVVAHPTSPRAGLDWTEWSLPVDGIEWLNADSQWQDDGPLALLRAAGGYWFRAPQSIASLLARPERALARWDALAAERQVVGLGALDAHANLALGGDDDGYGGPVGLRFPGYESTFRVFALRVELDRPPTGDAVADGAAVIARMRAGRTYTAVDALAGPVGFAYTGTTADGGRVRMGERAPPGRELTLNVTLAAPADAGIRLLRNGREVARKAGTSLAYPVPREDVPAAYRVEVVLPGGAGPAVPWIVSNPIYTGVMVDAAARPERRGPSSLPPGDSWRVERRTDAAASLTADDDGFRLAFELGSSADTYVAAARSFPPAALAGVGAVRLEVEASRPLRASLQLRRPRDRGPDARWRRSFYAGPEPRTVRAPIEEFAPAWSEVPAEPELGAVDSLLIVVDTVNAMPGAGGVLTVRELRVEPRPGR